VYVSSAAVYGADDDGAESPRPRPATHYGVTKLANEGAARIYWQDERIPSVALRPYTVYGPGRDQGVTSTPTQAMLAAARGEPYRISYGGYTYLQHAEDVGAQLVAASRAEVEGAHVFNMAGRAHMSEVVAAIEAAAPAAIGRIDFDDVQLPFPQELETGADAAVLGDMPLRPLAQGVRETIEHFRQAGQAEPKAATS
jgi:nucleoside-diphosphate-sugar epimerase